MKNDKPTGAGFFLCLLILLFSFFSNFNFFNQTNRFFYGFLIHDDTIQRQVILHPLFKLGNRQEELKVYKPKEWAWAEERGGRKAQRWADDILSPTGWRL
jgi:hypothetical protein